MSPARACAPAPAPAGDLPLSPVTLRFQDKEVEAAYAAKMKADIIQPLFMMGSLLCLYFGVFLAVRNSDFWQAGSPCRDIAKKVYLGWHIGVFAAWLLVCVLVGLSMRVKRMQAWNWEVFVALLSMGFTLSLYPLTPWFSAKLSGGEDPLLTWGADAFWSEYQVLLETIMTLMATCLIVPARVCILWTVPVFAMSLFVFAVWILGSPFPEKVPTHVAYLCFVCFVSLQGARRHERIDRERWLSVRMMSRENVKLEDVKRAYQQVASAFCDIVITLDKDRRVEQGDTTHAAFFGRRMEGRAFSEILVPEDRARFAKILEQASASQLLQSMPTTLNLGFAKPNVQLIIVDINPMNQRDPSWLIGVHSTEQVQSPGATLNPDIVRSMPTGAASGEEVDVERKTLQSSLPTTTETGQLFVGLRTADVEPQEDMNRKLEKIASIGVKEHWLVNPDDMELLPDHVLGSGGFGVVVTGRLRGTPVAVKLPRRGRHPQVASVSNEIRLHRHIRHPNIVLWHGACIDPQTRQVALIYELVNGLQLDTYVSEHLTGLTALGVRHKLLVDIARALRYLHTQTPTIVHNDLKTSNILVESWAAGPRAKLLDFGLSQLVTRYAEPMGGTLEWMAPETLRDGRQANHRLSPSADVFSFGRLAYFLCTGNRPLAVFQRTLIMHMAQQGRAVPLRWAGNSPFLPECRALCDKCLNDSPELRPRMAEVLVDLLTWLPEDYFRNTHMDVHHLTAFLKGSSWFEGLRMLEAEPLCAEPPFDHIDDAHDVARHRGQRMLDALEALVEQHGEVEKCDRSDSAMLTDSARVCSTGHSQSQRSDAQPSPPYQRQLRSL